MKSTPLKRVVRSIRLTADDPAGFIGMEDVESGTGRLVTASVDAPHETKGGIAFDPGDVLFGKLRPYLSKSWLAGRGGVCSSEFLVLRPTSALDATFLSYVVQSVPFVELAVNTTDGAKMPRTDWDSVGAWRFDLPSLTEQQAIAAFLDAETARLDQIVTAKQAIIGLLQQRTASAVEELFSESNLEELPLRRLCLFIRDGTHQPPERVSAGFPLLSVRNLVDGELVLLDDDSLVAETDFQELRRALSPQSGDVALAIVGATLGKAAIVGDLPPFVVQRSVAILRPDPRRVITTYLKLAIQSARFQAQLWSRVAFSAQPGVYLADIGDLRILLAPVEAQRQMFDKVDSTMRAVRVARQLLVRDIDLIHERRRALITAAVTGKIPIPGVAA